MNPFDQLSERYDRWFDSHRGKTIFDAEVTSLRELMQNRSGRWLEVGVGTGRFAKALEITEGVDPSPPMLDIARQRGIRVTRGCAEALPYSDGSFDGVLMVVTVCFLSDPHRAFTECSRVLTGSGSLIIGIVPADSPWGEFYAQRGQAGHPFYATARFYTAQQVCGLAGAAGLVFDSAISCLLSPPGKPIDSVRRRGLFDEAGFVALGFQKMTQGEENDLDKEVNLGA